MLWALNLLIRVLGFQRFLPALKRVLLDSRALFAHPSAQSRALGSGHEVFFAFLPADLLDLPDDPDLSRDLPPVEGQASVWVVQQLLRLSRVVVREEDETSVVDGFEQDETARWDALLGTRSNVHRLGLVDLGDGRVGWVKG